VLEWCRAGLLIMVFLFIQLLAVLSRGALTRGRDSFYAASAAACLATAFCEAYCDTTHVTVQMLAAIIVGLGLAQTKGLKAD
jgi:ABC-type Co2+ transport system permease subunit